VYNVKWSADGRRALSGSHDKSVRLWDVEDGRCLQVFEGPALYEAMLSLPGFAFA